ncbi:MAG TPA: hypothetical protein VGJ53_15005 [Micromonosporaceae bacterium]|jgi:hypothetical protein
MRGIKYQRNAVLATVTGISVGLAGVLLFARSAPSGTPDDVPRAAAATQTGAAATRTGTAGAAVRGPGIPPAPAASQNAPPDPNPGAPTANLKRVAGALQLRHKSVTAVVTLPAGLGVTNRVDVSVLFGNGAQSQRITQAYNNASGNRFVANFAANDGQKRREEVTISLLEAVGNGDFTPYAVRSTVDLEPLYDISLGDFTAYLYDDCDAVGDSEPHVYWRFPDGTPEDVEVSMSAAETIPVPKLARTFTEVGQSASLKLPVFRVWEEDVEVFGFHGGLYRNGATPLLPGSRTRTVVGTFPAENDHSCNVKLSYRITYQLRQYPNL